MELERIGKLVEVTYNRRRVTISTVKIGEIYESMVMLSKSGDEIESHCTKDAADAAKMHEKLVKKYSAEKPAEKPLTGKYKKLADDLKRIHADAVKACQNIDDGGTCNLDAPALSLPRWNAKQVEQAAKAAGVGCFKWDCYGSKLFVFCPRINGQAYRRERCAEYMTEALNRAGYDAITYCQMD